MESNYLDTAALPYSGIAKKVKSRSESVPLTRRGIMALLAGGIALGSVLTVEAPAIWHDTAHAVTYALGDSAPSQEQLAADSQQPVTVQAGETVSSIVQAVDGTNMSEAVATDVQQYVMNEAAKKYGDSVVDGAFIIKPGQALSVPELPPARQ